MNYLKKATITIEGIGTVSVKAAAIAVLLVAGGFGLVALMSAVYLTVS